jgi:uncharacterized protein
MPCLSDALGLPSDSPADAPGSALALAAGTVIGYAAVYYREGDPGTVGTGDDGEEVRIMPGAFDLAAVRGVRALFEHLDRKPLGSSAGGTLRLALDSRGLRFTLALPPTELGRKVLRAVKAGRLSGGSFRGSYTRRDEFTEGGRRVVEVHASTLAEISIVELPRFTGCGVAVSSRNPAADELSLWLAAESNQERAEG